MSKAATALMPTPAFDDRPHASVGTAQYASAYVSACVSFMLREVKIAPPSPSAFTAVPEMGTPTPATLPLTPSTMTSKPPAAVGAVLASTWLASSFITPV